MSSVSKTVIVISTEINKTVILNRIYVKVFLFRQFDRYLKNLNNAIPLFHIHTAEIGLFLLKKTLQVTCYHSTWIRMLNNTSGIQFPSYLVPLYLQPIGSWTKTADMEIKIVDIVVFFFSEETISSPIRHSGLVSADLSKNFAMSLRWNCSHNYSKHYLSRKDVKRV